MHAGVASLHLPNLSWLTRRGRQNGTRDDTDKAPCPHGNYPADHEPRAPCDRNISTGYRRHYEVLHSNTYGVPLLRVTFDQPWGIDNKHMTRLEFFKFTRDAAEQTRQLASQGILPHGESIDTKAQYFVFGTDTNDVTEWTHPTMLSIVPIAPTGSDTSPGHETTVIGNTPFADLKRTALAIIAENPQSFFDLTPYS